MTDTPPNISASSAPSLVQPPQTVRLKNGRQVGTNGDEWQLNPIGATHTIKFSRFKVICTPSFVNGLQWACHKRLSSKTGTARVYSDSIFFIGYLESLYEQNDGQIDLLSKTDILNLKESDDQRFTHLRGLLRCWVDNGYYGLSPEIQDILNRTHRRKRGTNRIECWPACKNDPLSGVIGVQN